MVVAKVQELSPRELGTVVRNDRVWDPEAVDNVGKKQHRLFGPDVGNGSDFNPLGELINCDQDMRVAPGCLFEWPDEI